MHPRLALIADGLAADDTLPPEADSWWADHTRVAEARPEAPAAAQPAVLPVPGRHAARRRLRLPAPPGWLPSLTPAHLALVAVAVAVALGITTWWVVRDQPATPAGPLAGAGETVAPLLADATASGAATEAASGAATGSVTVDVAGKVRRPGIVVLDQGARVTDALSAAGGARRGVDLTSLNLARLLVDGEQIVVGSPAGAAPPAAAAGGAAPAPGAAGPLVNLNLASQSELEALPQVGPVTAQSIIAWREQSGGFTSIDELLEVDGIGQKTLERLTPYVTV